MTVGFRHWDKTGTTVLSSGVQWGVTFAGSTITPRKYFIENISDRVVQNVTMEILNASTGNDASLYFKMGTDVGTIIPPYAITATVSAAGAGGTFAATGTYYYELSSVNGLGETESSVQVAATITNTTQTITLDWLVPVNALYFKIYRSTTSGSFEDPCFLTQTINGSINSFVDDGSTSVSSGAPAIENTTAGNSPNYGTSPTLSSASISIGNMAVNQKFVYWTDWVIPAGVTESLNNRIARIHIFENI